MSSSLHGGGCSGGARGIAMQASWRRYGCCREVPWKCYRRAAEVCHRRCKGALHGSATEMSGMLNGISKGHKGVEESVMQVCIRVPWTLSSSRRYSGVMEVAMEDVPRTLSWTCHAGCMKVHYYGFLQY